ncbi:MAG: crnA 1 [Geminicoccaceae bacterium]|nr:crnA 1 [Geminicoccaceae bacterium]
MRRRALGFALTTISFIALGASLVACNPGLVRAQVLRVAELNTTRLGALDRRTTVVILPGGVLEEHGPYLPSYTDGYANERMAAELASAIAARPGWTALVFPPMPLGVHGANAIGGKHVFPGTYSVREPTLRAVLMDLARALGDQGFRWIFVVNGHGGIAHNRALDDAGDYFNETYGGRMVHLLGLRPARAVDSVFESTVPPAVRMEDGFTVHADLRETSYLMALRPDLIPPSVAQAPSFTARDFADLVRIASQPDWPGYFGAPRHASAELGRRLVEAHTRQYVAIALRIIDGMDPRDLPRFADLRAQAPGVDRVVSGAWARDSVEEGRQRAWLAKRGRR